MTLERELLVVVAVILVVVVGVVRVGSVDVFVLLGVVELLGPVAVGAAPNHDHGEHPREDEVLNEYISTYHFITERNYT